MKKILYILPLFSLAFMSCEQDANVDVPQVDPELVINCFITPQDTFIRAKVSMSTPVFNTNTVSGPVTDATVTLYGNSSSVVLAYNTNTQAYETTTAVFPIIAGNEYHLVVAVPSGLIADAYTTVPANPPAGFNSTAEINVTYTDPYAEGGNINIHYELDDVAGQNDFYRLVPYEMRTSTFMPDTMAYRAGWDLFSDQNADGTHLARNFSTEYFTNGDSLVAIDLYLMRCNYDYYTYHHSLQTDGMSGDNPFSEPTLMYTNVNNGLGIFAAANYVYVRHWR